MQEAIAEARAGVRAGHGGPFGAVIVRDGQIVSRGHNEVVMTNDPTAHAEIVAIRRACALLGRFDISECEIYSSCEPCPMCFAAIHWAKMRRLYYAADRDDAAAIGFDDRFIYEVIQHIAADTQVTVTQIAREAALGVFAEWSKMEGKTAY